VKLPPHPLDAGGKAGGFPGREAAVLGAIVLLAAGARLAGIGGKSVWYDEALSLWFAQRDLGALWADTVALDFHTPFYYTLLHFWVGLFGDGEIALRSLSAAFSILSVPLVYALGRTLMGPAPAALGTLAYALSMMQVWYAQEARMYALLTFNAALALYGAARIMAAERQRGSGGGPAWLAWGCYVAGAAGAMWSHNTAALLPLAINAAVLGRWLGDGTGGAGFLGRWMAAQILVLALWAPWLPGMLEQAQDVDQDYWIQPPDLAALASVASQLYPTSVFGPSWLGPLLAAAVAVAAAWALRREGAVLAFLALAAFLPFAAGAVIGLWKPIFIPRTLVWVQIPYCLLIGALWRLAPGKLGRVLLVGMVAVASLLWLALYFTTVRNEPWAAVARDVARGAQAGDIVLFVDPAAHLPFDYYFNRARPPLPRHTVMGAFPVPRREMLKKVNETDVAALEARLKGSRRVWVIWRDPDIFDRTRAVARELSRLGWQEAELAYTPRLIVARYALPAP
jgi:mannosyltransferase